MQVRADAFTRANLAGLRADSWLKFHRSARASSVVGVRVLLPPRVQDSGLRAEKLRSQGPGPCVARSGARQHAGGGAVLRVDRAGHCAARGGPRAAGVGVGGEGGGRGAAGDVAVLRLLLRPHLRAPQAPAPVARTHPRLPPPPRPPGCGALPRSPLRVLRCCRVVHASLRQAPVLSTRATPEANWRGQVEGPYDGGEGDASAGDEWPSSGRVEFNEVVLRYPGSANPAVDGLTWTMESGHKWAVVGRTGAGKSTLVSAMTRMVPLESGRLLIGGVDIATLGLRKLRGAVSVVSQEPVIFAGTVRQNLDPFNEHSDAALWEVVDGGGMRELVEDKGGLGGKVAELGVNLSIGQRQLLCAARGLLRRCKVLLLDEATASLDDDNEQRVLRAIHAQAKDASVVHVAHRLTSLLWCNRVLVMGHGKKLEEGSPAQLAGNPDSQLSSMLRGAGTGGEDGDSGKLRAQLLKQE
eukprot:3100811-Rhodomonas_salina.1